MLVHLCHSPAPGLESCNYTLTTLRLDDDWQPLQPEDTKRLDKEQQTNNDQSLSLHLSELIHMLLKVCHTQIPLLRPGEESHSISKQQL